MSIDKRVAGLWMWLLACSAPDVHAWRVGINGKADKVDVANAVAIDAAGNVIAAGSIEDASVKALVVKLDAATGSEVWRREIDGEGKVVVVDAAGDVLVGGDIGGDTVVKLAGATGADVWRQDFGAYGGHAIVMGPGGDAVAVGHTAIPYEVRVAKLAGATGNVLWQSDIGAPASNYPNAARVTVDGNGDVVVAGGTTNVGTRDDWAVVKLSGTTGAELWRRELDGGINGSEFADAVVVDAAGDVIAGGYSLAPGFDGEFVVHKFSGTDGTDVWRRAIGSGGTAVTLALDAAGDVVAGGYLGYSSFAVVRLSAATGAELWRATLGNPGGFLESANAIAVRDDGVVVAVGTTIGLYPAGRDFTVATFDGATGTLLWRLDLDSGVQSGIDARYGDQAKGVAVGSTGDVVAVGSIDDQRKGPNFTVVQVSNGPVAGKQLVVTDRGDPSRRALKFKHMDPTLVTAALGGPNDPTIAGGAIRLTNPGTAEVAVIALPAANWEARAARGGVAWKYRDSTGLGGSCQSIRIEPLRRIIAKCRGAGIGYSLDEAMQGALAIEIETGAMEYCARFGGTVAADRPGVFKAKNAPLPASCP